MGRTQNGDSGSLKVLHRCLISTLNNLDGFGIFLDWIVKMPLRFFISILSIGILHHGSHFRLKVLQVHGLRRNYGRCWT